MNTKQRVGKLINRALKAGFAREVSVTQTSVSKWVSISLLHRTEVSSWEPWRAIYINVRVPKTKSRRRWSVSVCSETIYGYIDSPRIRGIRSAESAIARVEEGVK